MNSKVLNAALAAAALLGVIALAGCNDVKTELEVPKYSTNISEDDTSFSAFKKDFPLQHASYMKNNESEVMTEYKGSVAYRKNDNVNPLPKGFKHAQPYLKNLWLGYPFMYEYNEARGHTYALKDFVDIDRPDRYNKEKSVLPATCWNCKTPRMMTWIKKHGDSFWSKSIHEFRTDINIEDESVSCPTCHNPKNMELRLYSVPLQDWLKRSGKDWSKLTRNEKRSLVCAQCHVEYYFTHKDNGPAAKPVFPWDNGFNPEQVYEYYKTVGAKGADGRPGPFADWIHKASGVPMLKMQHPEYETFISSTHGAAGVSCADCHMAYQREGGKKVSSHWLTSPLKDKEMRACRQCHADKTADYLRSRVLYTQEKTYRQLIKAQAECVRAHEAIRLAKAWTGDKAANYDEIMKDAAENVRKAQMFWDWVSAENSVGFHNPALLLDTVMTSLECSMRATALAGQATRYGISDAVAGDIYKIVPPILELSRKLQQDADFLQTNPWLKLLPVLPKADQVWDGTKLLSSGS